MSEPLTEGSDASPPARQGVRIPIWLKILAALVVPLIVVAGLAFLQVKQANDRVAEVDEETALASVAVSPGGLVDALIVERGDALVTMLGIRETATFPTATFDESMAQTDTAVTSLKNAVADGGETAQTAFADALDVLDLDLQNTRDSVATATEDAGLGQWNQSSAAYDAYTQVIDSLNAANASLVAGITDPQLRAAGETLDDVNAAHDAVSNLSLFIGRSMLSPPEDLTARDNVAISLVEYSDARASLSSRTTGPWAESVRAYQTFNNYDEIELQAQEFLDTGEIELTDFIALNPAVTERGEAEVGTTQRIAQDATAALQDQIDTLRDDARTEQRNYTILAIVVVLGAAVLAALMARSVTRPLRRLTEQADEMASVRLPAAVKQVLETPPGQDVVIPDLPPLTVRSHDEVQAVAGALNKVQTSALDLAVEQATLRRNIADSFVSLGRRTQNLIGLQLEQITRLEEDEADPNVLESLYRLDHLATRARRNAESLVVLGGTEAKRTGGAPIRMTDIVRASLSEVEDYQRVELVQIDDVTVPAWSAADLIHLLAEITENGLIFSPPTSSVDVRGQRVDRGGYRITIEDRGVGMTDDKIREANVRLAGQESFTVAPSRYLGHYVAGRLAARIGASASLRRNSTGGIVAVIDVPESLLLEASTTATGPNASAAATSATEAAERAPLAPVAPIAAKQEERNRTASGSADDRTDRAPVGDGLDGFKTDGRPPVAPKPTTTTSTGLRKRVPGQHARPGQITGPTIPRNAPAARADAPTPDGDRAPAAHVTPTSPNLAGLLTAYNSGVEKGRQDAPDEAMPVMPGTNGSHAPGHDHDASDDHEVGPDDPRRDILDREHAP